MFEPMRLGAKYTRPEHHQTVGAICAGGMLL